MTSSAISLLSTVITPVTRAPNADQTGTSVKNGASSFSANLQKAGQAKPDKIPNNTNHDAKANKPSAATPTKVSGQADNQSAPDSTVGRSPLVADQSKDASKVEQGTEIKESPLNQQDLSVPANDPVKEENSVESIVDSSPPAALLPPQIELQVQVQPHPADEQEQVAESARDNILGTSILASISMGKSLDKLSPGEKITSTVAGKINAEMLSKAKEESPTLAGDSTSNPAALNATDASQTRTIAAQTMQPASEVAIKITPDKIGDGKPADTKASGDGVSEPSPAAATGIAQAYVPLGSSSSTTTATLQTPVSSPEWARNVGQQLVNFHLKGDQNVQLHLNPSNLGPMSITLNVNEHLQATAHFASHSGQVRSALEQGISQLREAMAQQGISLGETSVGEQRQQGFTQSDQGTSHRGNIQQLPGLNVIADEPNPTQAASAAGAGEISTYA